MSEDLIIREDGIGRLIRGVDALEIKLQNGGTSRWVRFNPRDQKSVNANGEYHAKDDGVDGYRTITVNVPTRTKSQEPGRDQEIFNPDTGTGYYTDDDGFLHEEFVPDEIRIMHVPDKTTYQDGEQIDLEGIVVQAYRDGEVWTSAKYPDGYIPVHEIAFQPTKADEESASKTGAHAKYYGNFYYYYTDYTPGTPIKIGNDTYKWEVTENYEKSVIVINHFEDLDRYYINIGFMFSNHPMDGYASRYKLNNKGNWEYTGRAKTDMWSDTHGFLTITYTITNATTPYNEVTWIKQGELYHAIINGEDSSITDVFDSVYRPNNYLPMDATGYNPLDFEYEPKIDAGDKISIFWPRPKDGKILSASFGISVEAAP